MGILSSESFVIQSTYHRTKGKIPGRQVFGQDMILPINHILDCRYIRQRKQAQIEKYIICKNSTKIDYDYRFGDKVIIRNKAAYKHETLFKGQYNIVQTWTNISPSPYEREPSLIE